MVRYIFVLLAGLLAAGPAAAAGWADGLFDQLSKDFGSVPHGKLLTHSFRIVNNTKTPVTISGIRVSCGCVSAQAQKGTLQPGEETTLAASMDTTRFYGVRSVTIFVQLSQPAFDEVKLTVQANSRSDFATVPDVLAFGQVRRGETPKANVTITFYGNPGVTITEVKPESNYVQPTIKEISRQDSEVAYQLTAKLRPDTPVGKWYTDVWVRTNNASIPQVRVPLTVEIQSSLTVSHETVDLGTVKVGGEAERRVIVRGVTPFKITSFEGVDTQLTVKGGSDEAKNAHVLTIQLAPTKPGAVNRVIRIHTNMNGESSTEVRVIAKVNAAE